MLDTIVFFLMWCWAELINVQVPLFVSTKMTKMRASLFVPTPEIYSQTCTRWIGYEKLVVPYSLHSLQGFLIRAIPDALLDSYTLSYFLYWRKKGLLKDSKIKGLEASNHDQANKLSSSSWLNQHLYIIKSDGDGGPS